MLKRNGQECRFEVPNFSGRLSASERQAYDFASTAVAEHMQQYNAAARALSVLSQQLKNNGLDSGTIADASLGSMEFSEAAGGPWQIRRSLCKTARNETLLCSRKTERDEEYGIAEKLDPESAYAKAKGNAELLITGNNAVLLLQDYVANECQVLELFKHDLEARIEEVLAEQYPGENLTRVVKAVSAQCADGVSSDAPKIQTQKTGHGVKVRF